MEPAIPTDSVIHGQGLLTTPLRFPLRIPQSSLVSTYQLRGINLFPCISLPVLGGGRLTGKKN